MRQLIYTFIFVLISSLVVFSQSENSPCPSISVSGGGYVREGETMFFTVSVIESAKDLKLEYEWTVSKGTIIAGQGTQTIQVDTNGLDGSSATATVKVKGLPENCLNTFSEVFPSGHPIPPPELIDEFGKISNKKVREKMDNLFLKLKDNPNGQGYIINYGTDKEIAAREKQIVDAVKFRKFDQSRITIVRGGQNPNEAGVFTRIFIVPPGAENPQP